MSTAMNNLFRTSMDEIYKATESNLRLHGELLQGWTRFWPGFTGRGEGEVKPVFDPRRQWSDGVLQLARTQQEMVDRQFDAALAAFNLAMGLTAPAKGPPVVIKPHSAAAEPPKAAPVGVRAEADEQELPPGATKNIYQKVAIVTGGASGIGEAVANELAKRGAKAVLLVDRSERVHEVASTINASMKRPVAVARVGDTTDEGFRKRVFNDAMEQHGLVTICVPAAGITRDSLSVRFNKETGRAEIYPVETFRQVTEVNLLAPIYWGIEMVARIVEDRAQRGLKRWEPSEPIQGVVVFLGSVSSQGNKGQISYAVAKAGLEGAAATLMKEAIFYGVRCGIIHPGFTDTPMVRALGEEFLNKYVLPYTQLRRLIRPEEIADAICFMIANSAVSGELWADAGWHPPA